MKKLIIVACLAAFTITLTSCGASRRGSGCPNGLGIRNL